MSMTLLPFKPMSPIATDKLPVGDEWIYQLKWDGYRLIAFAEAGQVALRSKNMLPLEGKFPEIAAACSRLPGTVVLDGEAVVLDPQTGKPDFQRLQRRGRLRDAAQIERAIGTSPVLYIVFDVLQLDGSDLRRLPFEERNKRLRELSHSWASPLHLTDCFSDGHRLWGWVVENGWEGVVCKRKSSLYKEGKTHRDWYKVKRVLEFEVDIAGIVWKNGRIAGLVMQRDGQDFGRVSSGLNEKMARQLAAFGRPERRLAWNLEEICPLRVPLRAVVAGTGVTGDGLLRHPRLIRLSF